MVFVEEHICDDIALADISSVTAYSGYHFRRLFYYLAEMPLSEYIRKRKMSLAAADLQNGCDRVIDLAVKYGYDNADSFTRAFVRQHGLTPTAAREPGAAFKIFPSLSFQIKIKGVQEMNWRIEKKDAFEVFGIERIYKNDAWRDIPAFWDEKFKDGSTERLIKQAGRSDLMGTSSHTDAEADGFSYMICLFAGDGCDTGGFKAVKIPEATWAIFRGEDMDSSEDFGTVTPKLFERAYSEWLPSSGYEKANAPEMELYCTTENGKFYDEIWIPVVKK
jgi:AraC family transcriptional regulator